MMPSNDTPRPVAGGTDAIREFEYKLNAMEGASHTAAPFDHGYAEKRARVLAFVADTEAMLAEQSTQLTALRARVEELEAAAATVCQAFDMGYFVRTLQFDGEDSYALRLAPYLMALGVLASDIPTLPAEVRDE